MDTFKTILIVVIVGVVFIVLWSYYGKEPATVAAKSPKLPVGQYVTNLSTGTVDIVKETPAKTNDSSTPSINWSLPVKPLTNLLPSFVIIPKETPAKGAQILNVQSL